MRRVLVKPHDIVLGDVFIICGSLYAYYDPRPDGGFNLRQWTGHRWGAQNFWIYEPGDSYWRTPSRDCAWPFADELERIVDAGHMSQADFARMIRQGKVSGIGALELAA